MENESMGQNIPFSNSNNHSYLYYSMKAINFTEFCRESNNLEEIKNALNFYEEKFRPDVVPEYFENWSIYYDDTFYQRGTFLINKSSGGWSTKITINDNYEYMFGDNVHCWQYLPKTISEFISDILRYGDFELILSEKAKNKIKGNI
jgi:hypothetical protein